MRSYDTRQYLFSEPRINIQYQLLTQHKYNTIIYMQKLLRNAQQLWEIQQYVHRKIHWTNNTVAACMYMRQQFHWQNAQAHISFFFRSLRDHSMRGMT